MKFRKKPTVIEAEQFLPDEGKWPKGVRNTPTGLCGCILIGVTAKPHVHTMHANQAVEVVSGDWIVPEPDGKHFYPIKDEVFRSSYDPVEEQDGAG